VPSETVGTNKGEGDSGETLAVSAALHLHRELARTIPPVICAAHAPERFIHPMPDRRYNDDEIAAIFQKAAEGPEPQGTSIQSAGGDGMTLAELRDIGREVGISPDAIDSAARSLELRPRVGERRFLGLTIGVERVIDLGRRLTEDEWERLVVELREVFGARGTVSSSGSFRQWTNGNLQALLEPTQNGQRLRLRTTKGNFATLMTAGGMMLFAGIFTGIATALAGHLAGAAAVDAGVFTAVGAGIMGSAALRLPGWARLRGQQMEAITTRLALATNPEDPERLPPT
jgi:hypothetical protein